MTWLVQRLNRPPTVITIDEVKHIVKHIQVFEDEEKKEFSNEFMKLRQQNEILHKCFP